MPSWAAGHVHIKDSHLSDWGPTVVAEPFPAKQLFHSAPVVAYHSLNGGPARKLLPLEPYCGRVVVTCTLRGRQCWSALGGLGRKGQAAFDTQPWLQTSWAILATSCMTTCSQSSTCSSCCRSTRLTSRSSSPDSRSACPQSPIPELLCMLCVWGSGSLLQTLYSSIRCGTERYVC